MQSTQTRVGARSRAMQGAIAAVCLAVALLAMDRIRAETTALDQARTLLTERGFEASIGSIAAVAARADADAASLLMLSVALMEGGYMDASSRALHRAVALDPGRVRQGEPLVTLFGTRHAIVRERIAREVNHGSLEALLVMGVFRLWSGEEAQSRAMLAAYDLMAGGDAVCGALLAKHVPRSETRARRYADGQRFNAALAEAAQAYAQQPTATAKARLAALLLGMHHFEAADRFFTELLSHTSPLERFELVLPDAASEWWRRDPESGLQVAASHQTLSGVVALAVLGRAAEAETALQAYCTRNALAPDRTLELHVFVLRAGEAPAPSHPPKATPPDRPQPDTAQPSEAGVLKALRSDDLSNAAQQLLELRKVSSDAASQHFLAAAILLATRDFGRATGEVKSWVLAEANSAPDAPKDRRLREAFSEQTLSMLDGWCKAMADQEHQELWRMLRVVFALEQNDDGALEELLLLEVEGGTSLILERLRTWAGEAVQGEIKPSRPAYSGKELLELGDAAFRAGEYAHALARYREAGVKDAGLSELPRALMRGAFATGDFRASGEELLRLLDEEQSKIGAASSVADFKTGIIAAYAREQDLRSALVQLLDYSETQAALSDGVWLLRGILEIERGAWFDADQTFRRYFRFSASPHPLARRFGEYVEAKLRE